MAKTLQLILVLSTLALAGCSWTERMFGAAATPERQAFRLSCEYAYLMIPAANYVQSPGARDIIVEQIRARAANLQVAMMTARATLQTGGDRTTAALAGLGSSLADFSLKLTGSAVVPDDPAALAGRAIVIAGVLARSLADMRTWREDYCKRKLTDMDLNDRAPTPEEWQDVDATLSDLQARLAGEGASS